MKRILPVDIVLMTEQYLSAMAELEKLCFGPRWTMTNFKRELESPSVIYFCAIYEDQIVGYLGYWKILEEAHITSVAVHPEFQGYHIAHALLCTMLDQCLEQKINWITLEVKETNIRAQNLYEKFGFSVLGRRKNYYQADRKDALIMWTENISNALYQQQLANLRSQTAFRVLTPVSQSSA